MHHKMLILFVLFSCFALTYTVGETTVAYNETSNEELVTEIDYEAYRQKLDNQTKRIEKSLKTIIKGAVKNLLPTIMNFNSDDSVLSMKCTNGLMKYISGMTSVKVWAMRMFDSMSKPPSGFLDGTFSDFGSFDQCLEIEVPNRKGDIDFRGQYCAIEMRPLLPPVMSNFSLAKQMHAKPLDTIGDELRIGGMAMYYLKLRFGICIPSSCSLEEMQKVAALVADKIEMDIKIPQCYVREAVVFKPVHIAVIVVLSLLLIACIFGTMIEYRIRDIPVADRKLGTGQQMLVCFSASSNFLRLMSASKGSEELKALHGLRAFSMAWVILGHTYVWTNFQLLRRPLQLVIWFNSIDFGSILNGWLSVEPFFLLSGMLTSYAAMKMLPKTKGRINVPIYILRRYIRLTPPLLLTMGLAFFMPLISSGPFWYERVDPEIRSCTNNWWQSLTYISNWIGMNNICVHPTWYLSADFQLHVVSVVVLYVLYRSPKLGFSLIAVIMIVCSVAVAALTYVWELPPLILISSGNDKQIRDTVDIVHMSTFTHAGPYYVGMIVGYLVTKYKDIKIRKSVVACFWLLSAVVSLSSLYGAHRWNIGEPHGPFLTAIYACLHRTTFTVGVAWVAFACVTGYGGLVNRFLSAPIFAPISRLTFMIYLLHSLVIWVRMGSLRERTFYSHYNLLYEYVGNIAVSLLVTVPFYLLLEAPLSNLERMIFSRAKPAREDDTDNRPNGHLRENMEHSSRDILNSKAEFTVVPVELTSVKTLENGCRNLAYLDDATTNQE